MVWLEKATDVDQEGEGDVLLVPVQGDPGELHVSDISVGELSLSSGYYPPDVLPHHSTRDVELMHERRCLDHSIERFESRA